jgi:hypothetical protein
MIREDTEYLSFGDGIPPPSSSANAVPSTSSSGGAGHEAAGISSAADETGPLPMYEDTQFLTGPVAGSGSRSSGGIGAGERTGGGCGGDDSTGLLIREDTCCLPDAPVAGEPKKQLGKMLEHTV